MPFFDTKAQRAAWVVAILGVGIFLALIPYASGLLGAPVLFVVFGGLHIRLTRLLRSRSVAAGLVIVLPLVWTVSLLVGQAQGAVQQILSSQLVNDLDNFRIGTFVVGPQLKQIGTEALSFVGGNAITLLGTATRVTLNLLFTFFGLYYLLIDSDGAWRNVRPYIPFSDENVTVLQERFIAVTKSTIVGTGFAALCQGTLVALGFWATGLGNVMFWGVVTAIVSILPVVGSGMVWGPGVIVLLSRDEIGWAVGLAIWGLVVIGNVDNAIRPWVSARYAQIHPLITLIGAVAGVSYMGIIGLLVGPLALSYFFELLKMYRKEYLRGDGTTRSTSPL